jgi:DHA2 family lincomycin resistance protein-like MFS transporter
VALLVSIMSVRSAALAPDGVSLVEQTAGGIHAAFVVAASLSLLAIVGAFFIRSSPSAEVPAGH